MACRALLADATAADGRSLERELLTMDRTSALMLVAQLDRVQLEAAAALQLVAHAATGHCAQTRLLHHDSWPEVRLSQPQLGLRSRVGLLPRLCDPPVGDRHDVSGGAHLSPEEASRLLDFRCHAPGGVAGRTELPAGVVACLRSLSSAKQPSSASVDLSAALTALGARDASSREAARERADAIIRLGLEGALLATVGRGLPAACCTIGACRPATTSRTRLAESRGRIAGAPSLHPLPTGMLEAWDREPGGEPGPSAGWPTPPPLMRGDSFVAAAAALHLVDARALLPQRFSSAWKNPCWLCNQTRGIAVGGGRRRGNDGGADGSDGGGSGGVRGHVDELCCIPYAHILGVSKCGTTDLHARLAAHPHVLPSLNKGPHFWDEPHTWGWCAARRRARSALSLRPPSLLPSSGQALERRRETQVPRPVRRLGAEAASRRGGARGRAARRKLEHAYLCRRGRSRRSEATAADHAAARSRVAAACAEDG